MSRLVRDYLATQVSRGGGRLFILVCRQRRPPSSFWLRIGEISPMRLLRWYSSIFVLVSVFFCQSLISQTTQDTSQSGSSSSPTTGAKAKPNCTDSGTYLNSKRQTVKRPENCSTAPQGAIARCRDGSYSFSRSRRGTCSHHGGVAKWL